MYVSDPSENKREKKVVFPFFIVPRDSAYFCQACASGVAVDSIQLKLCFYMKPPPATQKKIIY